MLIGILAGVAGAAVTFLVFSAFLGAAHDEPAYRARDGGARLDAWLDRLRTARAQSVDVLGPAGGFVLFFGAGIFLLAGAGIALGESLATLEGTLDRPTFHWIERIQDPGWAHLMNTVGKMGDIPQTRGLGVVAAVALMFLAPNRRWVPPVLIGSVIVVQKYAQAGVGKIVNRGHPPTTLGTYPSGGCTRIIAIFGVIIFLMLVYTKASRRWQGVGWGFIAMLAFIEGYTRMYLNKHWLTDVLGGWAFGAMLLAVSLFAGRALLLSAAHQPSTTWR